MVGRTVAVPRRSLPPVCFVLLRGPAVRLEQSAEVFRRNTVRQSVVPAKRLVHTPRDAVRGSSQVEIVTCVRPVCYNFWIIRATGLRVHRGVSPVNSSTYALGGFFERRGCGFIAGQGRHFTEIEQ